MSSSRSSTRNSLLLVTIVFRICQACTLWLRRIILLSKVLTCVLGALFVVVGSGVVWILRRSCYYLHIKRPHVFIVVAWDAWLYLVALSLGCLYTGGSLISIAILTMLSVIEWIGLEVVFSSTTYNFSLGLVHICYNISEVSLILFTSTLYRGGYTCYNLLTLVWLG